MKTFTRSGKAVEQLRRVCKICICMRWEWPGCHQYLCSDKTLAP